MAQIPAVPPQVFITQSTTNSAIGGSTWTAQVSPKQRRANNLKLIQAFEMAVLKKALRMEFTAKERLVHEKQYQKALNALIKHLT